MKGDLNAKVGFDSTGREDHNIMGKHGLREVNENTVEPRLTATLLLRPLFFVPAKRPYIFL